MPVEYSQLKVIHISLAMVSVSGFIVRWWWMRSESELLKHKISRSLPHVIDTLFLGSGIWLTVITQQYPLTQHWLSAKLIGLLAYIVLGSFALKRASTTRGRSICFVAALLVFGWIISVARSKIALGFLQV